MSTDMVPDGYWEWWLALRAKAEEEALRRGCVPENYCWDECVDAAMEPDQ